MRITFTIPIAPRAQKRFKITSVKGFSKAYKDKAQALYEGQVAALIAQHRPEKPIESALRLKILCFLPIPKSWSKKKRTLVYQSAIRPTGKPDCDNVAKNIIDIMSGVFFRDDAQIVELVVSKRYDDTPRWWIELEDVI